jgi:hypothetical protein
MIGNNLVPDISIANMQTVYDAAHKSTKGFEGYVARVTKAMLAPEDSEAAMIEIGDGIKGNVHSLPVLTAVNVKTELLNRDVERAFAILEITTKTHNSLTSLAGNM